MSPQRANPMNLTPQIDHAGYDATFRAAMEGEAQGGAPKDSL